jgi:ApbE superfamily uncharacterized protein (UPF0280 family)
VSSQDEPKSDSKTTQSQPGRGPFQARAYRQWAKDSRWSSFRVVVKETDLMVYAERQLESITRDLVLRQRGYLEGYIRQYPMFAETLRPWICPLPAPQIVRAMAEAGQKAGVGPMAAVAGAMAEFVGRELLTYSSQVIVENGGDIFMKCDQPATIGLFAGPSPLSQRIVLRIDATAGPKAVCTSSGTVGHSLSLGKADAVCIIADSGALADAAATAIGNRVHTGRDIHGAVSLARSISGVKGVILIIGKQMGIWGEVELAAPSGKKG